MTTIDKRRTGGFASMPLEQRREIASRGGKKCQESGKAYRWTTEQAREAGRKGGSKSRKGGQQA